MSAALLGCARRRGPLLLALLLIAGALIAQAAAQQNASAPAGPALSSQDAGPQGALALALWLQRLGYRVERAEGSQSSPASATRVEFVLAPTYAFTPADARRTLDWVRQGGVLVYVPSVLPVITARGVQMDDGLASTLGLGPRLGPSQAAGGGTAIPAFPYFVAPPAQRFAVPDAAALDLHDDAWAPLIRRNADPSADTIAALRPLGQGRVLAVASQAFFANASLGQADNAALVLNVLAREPPAITVAFDEYHHGAMAAADLASAVRGAPWGWAVLYVALVTFAFAWWGGRRFGPAVAAPRRPGRSGGDYVAAFAGLLQRHAGGRGRAVDWAQGRYAAHVRRQLARACGAPADLPAADLARVAGERRAVDASALAEQLGALDQPGLGERALLARMRALEPLLRAALDGRE